MHNTDVNVESPHLLRKVGKRMRYVFEHAQQLVIRNN